MSKGSVNTALVKKRCETKLNIEFRDAKEYNGWFEHAGKKVCRITVSKGRKPIPAGTYSSMARQLNLTKSDFDNLIACPLDLPAYILKLQEQGLIPAPPGAPGKQ